VIDLAVNKALTYDLLRQVKRPGTICSNDARSCYNLIGHSQASIAMQRNGVPKPVVDYISQHFKMQLIKSELAMEIPLLAMEALPGLLLCMAWPSQWCRPSCMGGAELSITKPIKI
jgi:hypothetical protein